MTSKKQIILYISSLLFFAACSHSLQTKSPTSLQAPVDSIRFNLKYPNSYPKNVVTEAYCKAISEYIRAVYKDDKPKPDTLTIGFKGVEFPDIELPVSVGNIPVRLLTFEETEKLVIRKSNVHLNLVGWMQKDQAEFIAVTFFEGGKPQHNCHIYFTHLSDKNEFKLDSLTFEYPYSK